MLRPLANPLIRSAILERALLSLTRETIDVLTLSQVEYTIEAISHAGTVLGVLQQMVSFLLQRGK